MTSNARRFWAFTAISLAASGFLASAVQAQQVYRIVGSDGKITFSDKPPPADSGAKVTSGTGSSAGGTASASLPFELRQLASRYPVTLYTGENCVPCGSARALLLMRGVPFTEKTVNTVNDSQALQRISGENTLPFATIGGQQLKGFSDAEWTQFLNAAGYPDKSVLPASYRQPPATPLVIASELAAAPARPTRPAAPTPAPAATPAANNPSGIRF